LRPQPGWGTEQAKRHGGLTDSIGLPSRVAGKFYRGCRSGDKNQVDTQPRYLALSGGVCFQLHPQPLVKRDGFFHPAFFVFAARGIKGSSFPIRV